MDKDMQEQNNNFCGVRIEKVKVARGCQKMTAVEQHNGKQRFGTEDNVRHEFTQFNNALRTPNFLGAEKTFERNKKLYDETHTKKMRKDAVMGLDVCGYISPDNLDASDPEQREAFQKCALEFMKKKFKGQDWCIWFHYDEKTPHFHAYVAMGKDGIFNANKFTGNGGILSQTQDIMADCFAPLGFVRGIKGSKDKHKKIQRYYAEQNKAEVIHGEQEKKKIKADVEKAIAKARETARKEYTDVIKSLGLKSSDIEENLFISEIDLDEAAAFNKHKDAR
jgi:hypothetical protein